MAMNPHKFKTVEICDANRAKTLIGKPTFLSALKLDELYYEVTNRCETVSENVPLQIAITVYDLSKLNLLRFYYDCMTKYLIWQSFELVLCDTDSIYAAYAHPWGLEGCVEPALRLEFYRDAWHIFFPHQSCEIHRLEWIELKVAMKMIVQRECCARAQCHDNFTPRKFKLEFRGDRVTALCPKTGVITNGQKIKVTSKGLSKKYNDLSYQTFVDVLTTGVPASGANECIIPCEKCARGVPLSILVMKRAISFFFLKRRVFDDARHCFCTWA